MIKVLSTKMMKDADNYAVSNVMPEIELIRKAGKAVFSQYHFKGKTLIIVGSGNNGGDGLALAKLLKEDNKDVSILQLFPITKPHLLELLSECIDSFIPIYEYSSSFKFTGYDTFVDAIFGIGFKGELDGITKEVVEKINSLRTYTISIDINSGLNADNGITKLAVVSDMTVAIGFVKPGLLLNDSKDYIKYLTCINIGIPYTGESYYLYNSTDFNKEFPKRKYNSHKGTYGYVGIMGGSYKYSGSVKLSNLALVSLSVGAGVSRVIAPYAICDSILPFLLESTIFPITSNAENNFSFEEDEIHSAITGLSALGLGMGMGVSEDNCKIIEYILLNYDKKLLIDADGLNNLSTMDLNLLNKSKADIVLTPHVKEFSRLINRSVEDILNNPIEYAIKFTEEYNVTLLLKGTATIISKAGKVYISATGSPALSKGGSGDILSGIITGLMGYKDALSSSISGAYIFGRCGDLALRKYGSYSPLPRDIINLLKEIMKKY